VSLRREINLVHLLFDFLFLGLQLLILEVFKCEAGDHIEDQPDQELHKENIAEPVEKRKVYAELFVFFLFGYGQIGVLVCSYFYRDRGEVVALACDSFFCLDEPSFVVAAAHELPFFFDQVDVDNWADQDADSRHKLIDIALAFSSLRSFLINSMACHFAAHGGRTGNFFFVLSPKGNVDACSGIVSLPFKILIFSFLTVNLLGDLFILITHPPFLPLNPSKVQTIVLAISIRHILRVQVKSRKIALGFIKKM